ncbi:MAG: hypothetical protein IPG01_18060 [Chitinophagaceae bacterium]|nr:hypothetical protein [Chitinophagaceae bacterium]
MKEQTNNDANLMTSKVLGKEAKTTLSSAPGNDNLFEDKELEGYPHYPAGEDIMNPGNAMEQIELSEEKISQSVSSMPKKESAPKTEANKSSSTDEEEDEEEEEEIEDGGEEIRGAEDSETNITREDLIALDTEALNLPEGDDAPLRKRPVPVDMSGDELDIPGSELDDEAEMIGSEDEENNAYSIGGDRHDDLEENGTEEEEEEEIV